MSGCVMRASLTVAVVLAVAFVAGCQAVTSDGPSCSGKCDDPGGSAVRGCLEKCDGQATCFERCRDEAAVDHCEARRSDAVASGTTAYTDDAIRWACADVEGVDSAGGDDRGQEYCEYYAIVAPPPAAPGEAAPPPVDLGRLTRGKSTSLPARTTSPGLELTEEQIYALEDNPDAVVGACVFGSWHADIYGDPPVCRGPSGCPEIALPPEAHLAPWMTTGGLGFALTEQMLRMKSRINSNRAAADLAYDCMVTPVPDVAVPERARLVADPYMRGCLKVYELYGSEWRRSDPTICAATSLAAECGCGVDADGDGAADITDPVEVAAALVPPPPARGQPVAMRGFPLGTWSGDHALPAGCRYLDLGDDSRVAVACTLTATDLLVGASDVKSVCRSKYGDNVVVHVPIPASKVVCHPHADAAAAACGGLVSWTAVDLPRFERDHAPLAPGATSALLAPVR
jgi:hypothetical protein